MRLSDAQRCLTRHPRTLEADLDGERLCTIWTGQERPWTLTWTDPRPGGSHGNEQPARLDRRRPRGSRARPVLNGVTNGMSAAPEMTLKLGDGDELRGPLGAVLMGGMATSTFLSPL